MLQYWDILNFNGEVVRLFQNESEGAKCLGVHGLWVHDSEGEFYVLKMSLSKWAFPFFFFEFKFALLAAKF